MIIDRGTFRSGKTLESWHTAVTKEANFSDKGPMLETLDYTIRIGSTPTFLYFDLYLYSAYAAHYV